MSGAIGWMLHTFYGRIPSEPAAAHSEGQQAVQVNVPAGYRGSRATVFSQIDSGLMVYACNTTYGGVVFAYGSGPIAVLHFSLRAVGIDERSRPRLHQLLDLR